MQQFSLSIIFILAVLNTAYAQPEANYDETKVPEYNLPDLLITQDGKEISDPKEWMKVRRPEIISLFEEYMYGRIPGNLKISSWRIVEENKDALNGKAVRKQVILTFKKNKKQLDVNLLVYLPKNIDKAPLFIGYNFYGNHTIADDPNIIIPTSWSLNKAEYGITDHQPNEKSRGAAKSRWALEKIIDAGYGLATMFYGDVDPDKYSGYGGEGADFSDGVHPLLYRKGQTNPLPNEWGSITAWAWGLSRAMDYLEKDKKVDKDEVIVMGHSRLGKTSLWAGALDERFAIVISNNSGAGGAALSRRRYGETLGVMDRNFENWFCDNLSNYADDEDSLPVDQHMLIALIAPRPVYIASAEEDKWADPKGEFLSGYHANPVYQLFGKKGLPSGTMPGINQPLMTTIGYHIRTGGHDVTDYDWEQYITFANLHLKRKI